MYSILIYANLNESVFLISVLDCLLLVHRNTTDVHIDLVSNNLGESVY